MLILTRREGEVMIIGENITISVKHIKGNQVRLGINAPKEISVHRAEVYQRLQEEARDQDILINSSSFYTAGSSSLISKQINAGIQTQI